MKSHSRIKIAYIIYVILLLILLLFLLMYSWKSLTLYEASQPEHLMDEILVSLEEQHFNNLDSSALPFNNYETEEQYKAFLQSLYGKQLSYEKIRENYTDHTLLYDIYAGNTKIAEATLAATHTYQRMLILSITDWELHSLEPYYSYGNYTVTVTMPDNYSLSVNGVTAADTDMKESSSYPFLTYCEDYVSVPQSVTYEIGPLANPAQIDIYDPDGERITADEITNANHTEISLSFSEEPIPEDLKTFVLEAVERYSNFFSKDLPGCRESIDPIRDLFPEDSVYLTLADQYRREDMGVFSSHTNTHFLNESVSSYVVYNENCFSCRVSFEKSMTLGSGREMIDVTDNVYYFVKIDENWVIADIVASDTISVE